MSFYSSKIFLDQSKKFGLVQNVLDMDQIAKLSSEKLFFESNPKQFGQIQNDLESVEGQSNSCVMNLLFFIRICINLIKFLLDFGTIERHIISLYSLNPFQRK